MITKYIKVIFKIIDIEDYINKNGYSNKYIGKLFKNNETFITKLNSFLKENKYLQFNNIE